VNDAAERADRAVAEPFDVGEGRDAALCLHGLTGTPYEVRPLGEALAARGVRAVGPMLPGHGGSAAALAAVGHGEWIAAVQHAHRELRARHERVFTVGLSLGGLLALWLAAAERVDALVVVATPLRLNTRLARLVPIAKWVRSEIPKRRGSDIRDAAARARHPSLEVMPVASVHELVRLQRRVRLALPRVTAPILVAHGGLDRTADPTDARLIAGRVSSGERGLLWLRNSGHVVPVDHDGPELARAAVDFLTRTRHPLRYGAR
jgi:carboxylesterase